MNKNLLVFKTHAYDSGLDYSCSYKFWPNLASDPRKSEKLAYDNLVEKANTRIKELEFELHYLKEVMKGVE